MPDTITGIVGFLLDQSFTGVEGNVYGGELPRTVIKDMPQPAILVRPAGGGFLGTGTLNAGDTRIDVTCYGVTPLVTWQLYLEVKLALKHMSHEKVDDTLLIWAKESSSGSSAHDLDTEWPTTVSSWQVFAGEGAT